MATIDYAVNYPGVVDEVLKYSSKSEGVINKNFDFIGAKSVKVYDISVAPLNDYKRTGSNRYGTPAELDATAQEMIMSQDKSFTFVIDKMDEDETKGALNAGQALERQLSQVVVPMVDKYRFTKLSTGAGTKAEAKALTSANIFAAITDATEVLDNAEVPETGRQIIVSSATYKAMKLSKDIVMETEIGQDMRARGVVALIDGMEVIKVPASRLPENFGFLVTHPMAAPSPVKLAEYKVNDNAPGYSGSLVEGRIVFDCFILDNKKSCIYYQAIA